MSENTPYFQSIVSARSLAHFAEDEIGSLEGTQLISIESEANSQEQDTFVYVTENFAKFLELIRLLKPRDQELLLAYYSLRKTQTQLAPIFGTTQTVLSFQMRIAIKTLCAYIIFNGTPKVDQLRSVLESAGWEEIVLEVDKSGAERTRCSMALMLIEFESARSFTHVASVYGVRRPEVRRAFSRASKALLECKNPAQQAVGAWIHTMINKANPHGKGLTVRETKKRGDYRVVDPYVLGEFRIKIDATSDKLIDKIFASRGNL